MYRKEILLLRRPILFSCSKCTRTIEIAKSIHRRQVIFAADAHHHQIASHPWSHGKSVDVYSLQTPTNSLNYHPRPAPAYMGKSCLRKTPWTKTCRRFPVWRRLNRISIPILRHSEQTPTAAAVHNFFARRTVVEV